MRGGWGCWGQVGGVCWVCAAAGVPAPALPAPYTLPPSTLSHRRPGALQRHHACIWTASGLRAPHHPATALLPPCPSPVVVGHTLAHTYTLESYRGATPAQPDYCLIVQRNTGALLGPLRPTSFHVLVLVVRRVSPFSNQVLQQAVRIVAGLKCSFQNVGDLDRIAHAASCWSAPGPGFRRGCMARRGAWRAVRFASLRSAAAGERWANHAGQRLASGGCRSRRPWSERFE